MNSTHYRVRNRTVCHGCWNDTRIRFDHFNFVVSAQEKSCDKFRVFKAITGKMVIDTIKPGEKRQMGSQRAALVLNKLSTTPGGRLPEGNHDLPDAVRECPSELVVKILYPTGTAYPAEELANKTWWFIGVNVWQPERTPQLASSDITVVNNEIHIILDRNQHGGTRLGYPGLEMVRWGRANRHQQRQRPLRVSSCSSTTSTTGAAGQELRSGRGAVISKHWCSPS